MIIYPIYYKAYTDVFYDCNPELLNCNLRYIVLYGAVGRITIKRNSVHPENQEMRENKKGKMGMRKQKAKRNMMGIFLLVVMGITLLTPSTGMNEVKAATGVTISPQNFPDDVFRQWVGTNFDENADGILSDDERLEHTIIFVPEAGITSLKGIEFFPNLAKLYCAKNNLSTLDVSKNTNLTLLDCQETNLSSLDVSSNTALKVLYCSKNKISSLDVSSNTALTDLYCDENNLSTLNVSYNTDLTDLVCGNNNLSSLDVSKNSALEMLNCDNNNISSLDVSKNPALDGLDCSYNNISNLDVSHNPLLGHFVCSYNNLSSLDVSHNPAMHRLYCAYNNLTSLDVSNNTNLSDLNCEGNSLYRLDLSKNTKLMDLNCEGNSLCSLDLSKNTKLESFLQPKLDQYVRVPMYKNGDEYYIDLSGLLLDDGKRLSLLTESVTRYGATYDSTTNRINLSEKMNVDDTVWYGYETNGPSSMKNTKMQVSLKISEVRDITEPATEEPTTEEPAPEEPTAEGPIIEEPTTTEPATTQTDNGKEPTPQTGDTTPLYLVISLIFVSFVGGVTLYIRRKQKL